MACDEVQFLLGPRVANRLPTVEPLCSTEFPTSRRFSGRGGTFSAPPSTVLTFDTFRDSSVRFCGRCPLNKRKAFASSLWCQRTRPEIHLSVCHSLCIAFSIFTLCPEVCETSVAVRSHMLCLLFGTVFLTRNHIASHSSLTHSDHRGHLSATPHPMLGLLCWSNRGVAAG